MKLLTDMTKQATELAAALQEERDQSAGPLAHGVERQRHTRSRATATRPTGPRRTSRTPPRRSTSPARTATSRASATASSASSATWARCSKIRGDAYETEHNSTQTVESYHRLITHLLDLSQDMARGDQQPRDDPAHPLRWPPSPPPRSTRPSSARSSRRRCPRTTRTSASSRRTTGCTPSRRCRARTPNSRSFKSIYGTDSAADLLKPIEEGNPTITATDKYAKPRPRLHGRPVRPARSGRTRTGWTTARPRSSR